MPPATTTSSTDSLTVDLLDLARLATEGDSTDVRLFLGKLIRKYRQPAPALAKELDSLLATSQVRGDGPAILRRGAAAAASSSSPVDADSNLDLIRVVDTTARMAPPILPKELNDQIDAIIREHAQRSKLEAANISPSRSALLVGPPGVGKTLTAMWIAHSLGKPLWVLDLAAIMSSLLGKTGANLRAALNYAKQHDAILLLDEIDAVAKKRADVTDVGELKRLVAVILQEVDQWPDTSLLLGATNHPELLDPALWRRFDVVLEFDLPRQEAIQLAIARFFGKDLEPLKPLSTLLTKRFIGKSIAEVNRSISSLKRAAVFDSRPMHVLIGDVIRDDTAKMSKAEKLEFATHLAQVGESHYEISRRTGLSRDTIRKHAGPSKHTRRGRK